MIARRREKGRGRNVSPRHATSRNISEIHDNRFCEGIFGGIIELIFRLTCALWRPAGPPPLCRAIIYREASPPN